MGNRPPSRREAVLLVAAFAASGAASCTTTSLWMNSNSLRGKKVTAALLTPVTVAVDAALVAGAIFVVAHACGSGLSASSAPPEDPAAEQRAMAREALDRAARR